MEEIRSSQPVYQKILVDDSSVEQHDQLAKESFKPTGAIVFFIALIILCLITWYSIYFIMLSRV